jgi:hypothetical protein
MKKSEVKWQHIRMLLRAITNENGIVVKDGRDIAQAMELPNYSKLSYIIKVKDKIFNGNSDPHINEISKKIYQKYITFDFQKARSKRKFVDKLCDEIRKKDHEMIQQKIEFKEPHPINNILGISAENTIQNVNQSQLYDLNIRVKKLEKNYSDLEKLMSRKIQAVERFFREWGINQTVIN